MLVRSRAGEPRAQDRFQEPSRVRAEESGRCSPPATHSFSYESVLVFTQPAPPRPVDPVTAAGSRCRRARSRAGRSVGVEDELVGAVVRGLQRSAGVDVNQLLGGYVPDVPAARRRTSRAFLRGRRRSLPVVGVGDGGPWLPARSARHSLRVCANPATSLSSATWRAGSPGSCGRVIHSSSPRRDDAQIPFADRHPDPEPRPSRPVNDVARDKHVPSGACSTSPPTFRPVAISAGVWARDRATTQSGEDG